VVPYEGQWGIIFAGGETPSLLFETRDEAIHEASLMAKNQNSEIVIHDDDGSINSALDQHTKGDTSESTPRR
jgi:hypothetical protein